MDVIEKYDRIEVGTGYFAPILWGKLRGKTCHFSGMKDSRPWYCDCLSLSG